MKRKRGGEMNKLLWSFTIPVLLVVTAIVAFYLAEGIVSANNSAKHTKQLLIEQTVQSYKRMGENFQGSGFSMEMVNLFNPEIVQAVLGGNAVPLYGLTKNMMTISSPATYVAIVVDGQVKDQTSTGSAGIDTSQLPLSPPSGNYKLLDSFGGTKGTFVDVFYPIDLTKLGVKIPKYYVSVVFNLTSQVSDINNFFNDQKRNTIIKLSITGVVALLLFALLSTFWLRYLIRRYIRKPVEDLNSLAEEVAAGTFRGEVVVDKKSDFAALQGLLKSGQLILRKFDEKMEDQS